MGNSFFVKLPPFLYVKEITAELQEKKGTRLELRAGSRPCAFSLVHR